MINIIPTILPSLTDTTLIALFYKAFAVLFSVMYLVYAIVITHQTQVMNRTVTTEFGGLLLTISFSQIVLGLILIFLSLTQI